jgi:hypothetical protein
MSRTITSKFDLGDEVWIIQRSNVPTWVPCAFCGATGQITGANGQADKCPKCYDRKGKTVYEPEASWHLLDNFTGCYSIDQVPQTRPSLPFIIGQIKAEITAQRNGVDSEFNYMCNETGVGSGTLWPEREMFATKIEAIAECDKRNEAQEAK